MIFGFKKTSTSISSFILEEHGDPIQIKVLASSRSKRVIIKISKIHGPELVLPKYANQNEAIRFLKSKELWIRVRMKHCAAANSHNIKEIPIFGDYNNAILIETKSEVELIKIKSHLKLLFKKAVFEMVDAKSKQIGVKYKSIKIKELSSRWGSCSKRGNLNFSWRLVFAPKEVLEYVVIHELCHIIEFNHSTKFWSLVAKYCPHYIKSRQWLKAKGTELHSYLRHCRPGQV